MITNVISYLSKIDQLCGRYLASYPQDAGRLSVLLDQLAKPDEKLNDRKNMIGHLTASALVMDKENNCLLIHHRSLERWLQPGGHLEAGEMPEAGALRELREETSLTGLTGLKGLNGLTNLIEFDHCPIDIDSHSIPASSAKREGEHLHHDFQYVFRLEHDGDIALDQSEVSDYKWVSLDELQSGVYGQRLARVAGKIWLQSLTII